MKKFKIILIIILALVMLKLIYKFIFKKKVRFDLTKNEVYLI
jgi:hypothetical protein